MTQVEQQMELTTQTRDEAQPPATQNPMALMQMAVERGTDPAQLEKLMDLHERWQATQARNAFNRAMADVQAELPRVCSDAKNTQTNSRYPTEARVRQSIQGLCLQHGFTFVVDEASPPVDDIVHVRLVIRHVDGHEVTMTRYGKVDMYGPKGNPNSTHVQGCQKTVTYLGRRMLLQAFGVVVDGDDNDGNTTEGRILEKQAIEINDILREAGEKVNKAAFLKWADADSVEDIPAKKYAQAIRFLRAKMGDK